MHCLWFRLSLYQTKQEMTGRGNRHFWFFFLKRWTHYFLCFASFSFRHPILIFKLYAPLGSSLCPLRFPSGIFLCTDRSYSAQNRNMLRALACLPAPRRVHFKGTPQHAVFWKLHSQHSWFYRATIPLFSIGTDYTPFPLPFYFSLQSQGDPGLALWLWVGLLRKFLWHLLSFPPLPGRDLRHHPSPEMTQTTLR